MATASVELVATLPAHKGRIAGITLSPKSDWLVTAFSDGIVMLSDIKHRVNRFQESIQWHRITDLEWSAHGDWLACSTMSGNVVFCDAITLEPAEEQPRNVCRGPLWCISWDHKERRVAAGGEDGRVYVVPLGSKTDIVEPLGIGHRTAVRSLAWRYDCKVLASGSEAGYIGLWDPNSFDKELRDFLPESSRCSRAHAGPIFDLAWFGHWLASASGDGRVRLWDTLGRVLLRTFDSNEPVFGIDFSTDGQVLVARTLNRIVFFRTDTLQEIDCIYCPATRDAGRTLAHPKQSVIATTDAHTTEIKVWRIDFDRLIRDAKVTRRKYSNAKVLIIGAKNSGKTSLARALGTPVYDSNSDRASIFRLSREIFDENGTSEVRDVLLWDVEYDFRGAISSIHTNSSNAVLLTIDASQITFENNHREELHALANIVSQLRFAAPAIEILVAATKVDTLSRSSRQQLKSQISQMVGIVPVFLTSTVQELGGLDYIANTLFESIDWATLPAAYPMEMVDLVRQFIADKQNAGLVIGNRKQLCSEFTSKYPTLNDQSTIAVFESNIVLLENIGSLYCFSWGDQVLLDPWYFYRYASAFVRAAVSDQDEMGRVRLDETSRLIEHLQISSADRVSDEKQEAIVLTAVVEEIVTRRIAGKVSANNGTYLVFPMQPKRILPANAVNDFVCTRAQFPYSAANLYSSLVVKLLGLNPIFKDPDLYRNSAKFHAGGGVCRLELKDAAGENGELSVLFDGRVDDSTRSNFVAVVKQHVEQAIAGETVQWTSLEATSSEVNVRDPDRPQVFVSCDIAGRDKVRQIVDDLVGDLRGRHIDLWVTHEQMTPGKMQRERQAALERHRIALVIFSQPVASEALKRDWIALRARKARIIPVLLPSASDRFKAPEGFDEYTHADFRTHIGQAPLDRLAAGIFDLHRALKVEPVQPVDGGHVFLSYCRDDADVVRRLRDQLSRSGHPVWIDEQLRPGEPWRQAIRMAMRRAYAVMVCLSPRVSRRSSSWMYPEISDAIAILRTLRPGTSYLIPVILEPCEIPEIQIDELIWLDSLQAIDLSPENYKRGLSMLLDALEEARAQRVGFRDEPVKGRKQNPKKRGGAAGASFEDP